MRIAQWRRRNTRTQGPPSINSPDSTAGTTSTQNNAHAVMVTLQARTTALTGTLCAGAVFLRNMTAALASESCNLQPNRAATAVNVGTRHIVHCHTSQQPPARHVVPIRQAWMQRGANKCHGRISSCVSCLAAAAERAAAEPATRPINQFPCGVDGCCRYISSCGSFKRFCLLSLCVPTVQTAQWSNHLYISSNYLCSKSRA